MAEGKRFSDALTFDNGDLEVDATALRNFFVGKRSPNYQFQIERFVTQSRKGSPDVMRAHARVLGICQRGGFTALKVLPFRFVAKNGVPPVENTEEVMNSGLIQRITKPGKCVLFTDGATSYKGALKKIKMRIQHRRAIHAKKQWSVKTRTKAGHSKVAGTMCIDAQWKSMKKFIHPSVKSTCHFVFNENLWRHMWHWLHRFNRQYSRVQLFLELGRLAKKSKCPQVPKKALLR